MGEDLSTRKKLAIELVDHHPGVPEAVAEEIVESMMVAIRRVLLREREVNLQDICALKITELKRKPYIHKVTKKAYLVNTKYIMRMRPSKLMKQSMNHGIDRRDELES